MRAAKRCCTRCVLLSGQKRVKHNKMATWSSYKSHTSEHSQQNSGNEAVVNISGNLSGHFLKNVVTSTHAHSPHMLLIRRGACHSIYISDTLLLLIYILVLAANTNYVITFINICSVYLCSVFTWTHMKLCAFISKLMQARLCKIIIYVCWIQSLYT